MKTKSDCPNRDTLFGLVSGTIESNEILDSHIRSCETCKSELDHLTKSDLLDSIRPQVTAGNYSFLEAPKRENDLGAVDGLLIEKEIGRGGVGIVFRAIDESLNRPVALKVLNSDFGLHSYQRFQRESKAAAAVSGDHVVRVFSLGTTASWRPYLTMELIEGESLSDYLNRYRAEDAVGSHSIGIKKAADLARQIATGLDAIHGAGLVHRDIKPANVLLDAKDNRAKLTDFGLARDVKNDTTFTQANILSGTPLYMSPEQAQGDQKIGYSSDIYSLGITLYEMLTGAPPFQGTPLQILQQHREVEPIRPASLNPGIPRDLETVCLKALQKEPGSRYQSAQEFAEDLSRFLNEEPIQAREVNSLERLGFWCRRNRSLATAMALVLFTLLAGTITSTTLWLRGREYANQLEESTKDLSENRAALRDSVSRFQSSVFSTEALHWNMAPPFRRQMFQDIIEYLDKFAELDAPESSDDADVLTSDYLQVAKASLDVDEQQEAELASRRALERMRMINEVNPSFENLLLHGESALVAFRSARASSDGGQSRMIELADESVWAARQSEELQSNYFTRKLMYQAKLASIIANKDSGRDELVELIESIKAYRNEFGTKSGLSDKEIPKAVIDLLQVNIESNWELALCSEADEAIKLLEENHTLIWGSLRDKLRLSKEGIVSTDELSGINHSRRAAVYRKLEQHSQALELSLMAIERFDAVLKSQPQNRICRKWLADEELVVRDLSLEMKDLELADQYATRLLKNLIYLKERDPKNFEMAQEIILRFAEKGQISKASGKLEQYYQETYIAASDSMLLMHNDQSRFQWALETRVWAFSRLKKAFKDVDENHRLKKGLEATLERWCETAPKDFPDADLSMLPGLKDGSYLPERPKWLTLTDEYPVFEEKATD